MYYAPSIRFFVLLVAIGVLSLGCFYWDTLGVICLSLLGLVLAGAALDLYLLSRCRAKLLKTYWTHQPTVQRPFAFTVELETKVLAEVFFGVEAIDNDALMPSKTNAHMEKSDAGTVLATWELFPKRRGELEWAGANVHFRSRLRLIDKWQRLPRVNVPVYPKLSRDLQSQLNPDFLMDQMGLKTNRYLRADQDFESLRPYVLGDNYRHIDWKASARMQSLITRQFQVEHHHNILVCLDTSRLMGTMTEGISKLDWAIEASLHLAYLASRFGDRMGLLVFSNDIQRWIKPMNQPVEAFLRSVYNLESSIVEADLTKVCTAIMAAQKKRSLVIFLSDFLEASSLEPSLDAFGHLNRKHCTLFIGIEDPAYRKYLEQTDCDTSLDLTRKIVAQDSMRRRQAVLQQLRQMGLRTLTTSPEDLVQRAMNAYMEIKFQGAI